jgi:thiamine biosynthesis protein ThiS
MRLTVNGKPREAEGPLTLLGYLESLGINPRIVAVEHNGEIVKRARLGDVAVNEGDVLEIVRMVGGGARGERRS